MATLGERLTEGMRLRRLTASQLVEAMTELGRPVKSAYIYQLRNGTQTNPTLGVLGAIATSLQVSVGWLVGEDFVDSGLVSDLQARASRISVANAGVSTALASVMGDVLAMTRRAEELAAASSDIARKVEGLDEARGLLGDQLQELAHQTPSAAPAPRPTVAPAGPASPLTSTQRRALALWLRRLRSAYHLPVARVAAALGQDEPAVLALENAQRDANPRQAEHLLDLCRVLDPFQRGFILRLARGERESRWFDELDMPLGEATLYEIEHRAAEIRTYQMQHVHQMLQTEDYARAIHELRQDLLTPEDRRAQAERIYMRQQWLERDENKLWTVIDESVLMRPIGGPSVLLGQIDALIDVAKRPNVALQVARMSSTLSVPSTAFTLWRFGWQNDDDIAAVPTAVSGPHLTADRLLIDSYVWKFDAVSISATQPGAPTLDLLREHRARLAAQTAETSD